MLPGTMVEIVDREDHETPNHAANVASCARAAGYAHL